MLENSSDQIRHILNLMDYYANEPIMLTEAKIETTQPIDNSPEILNDLAQLKNNLMSRRIMEGTNDYQSGYEAGLYKVVELIEIIEMKYK